MNSKKQIEKQEEEQAIALEITTEETHVSKVKKTAKTTLIPKKSIENTMLEGKTLQVYWYLLEQGSASVREIHKALGFSSPGIVYYQIKKLIASGFVSKNEESDKYFVNENIKPGLLNYYVNIRNFVIPRFSIYLSIFLSGFIAFFIFFLIWGDPFITNPGTWLFLLFQILGSLVFIYESRRTWKLKPN
ncbi:MAG: helix-turn-helix domain-containing protein [Candidatus Hodarchaeales archaeon]|jgi:hypothetical protein